MIETDLHGAIKRGDAKAVSTLLEQGSSPVLTDGEGHTPLDIAAVTGHKSIIDILVQQIEKKTSGDLASILHRAVLRSHDSVVESILKHGGDPNAYNDDGATPLHVAAKQGDLAIVKILIRHGADPQKLHRLSQATPAQMAGPHGNPEIEKFLTDLMFKKAGGKEAKGLDTILAIGLAAVALLALVLVPRAKRKGRKA